MTNSDGSKVLTISLLCCGRPETTEKCLQSLMPIKEKVDCEIQVIDTGCSKETRDIVEKYADQVFEFTWCNDFAAARNEQLKHAHGKWFLYLDDDEYFEKTDGIINLFSTDNYKKYNYGGYTQRNYVEPDGSEYQDIRVGRMTKLLPETEFWGKVHEFIRPETGDCIYVDDYVGHFGYCYTDEETNKEHALRNIPLLIEMMEDEPEEYRWPYQLAQEYRSCKMNQELYDLMVESLKKLEGQKDGSLVRYRSSFVCGKAIAQEALGKNEELIADYLEISDRKDIFDIAKARVAIYSARIYLLNEDYANCEKACNFFLQIAKNLHNNKGAAFIQTGIFMHDTFDAYHLNYAYSSLIICGYKRNDLGPLMKYYKEIAWDRPKLSMDSAFVTGLLIIGRDQGNAAGINKVFDRMLARIPLKGFIQSEIRKMAIGADIVSLKKLKGCFKNTCAEKEMEAFMDSRILENDLLSRNVSSFGQAREMVREYSATVEKWYEFHRADLEKPKDKTNETPDYKVALKLSEFDKVCEDNVKKSMKLLKDSSKIYPLMAPVLKSLGEAYGDYQKVKLAKAEDPSKFEEMYNLEAAVLQQIAQLTEAGHGADAATTRGQLEGILMQTYGVKSLH